MDTVIKISRVSAFLRNVSMLISIIILVIIYSFLKEKTGLLFDQEGRIILTVSKNTFFYGLLALMVLPNLSTLFLNRYAEFEPDPHNKKGLSPILKIGLNLVLAGGNLFLSGLIIFNGLANNTQDYSYGSLTFIPIVSLIPLITSIISIPLIWIFYIRSLKNPGQDN